MSYKRIKREILDDEDTRHLSAEETDDNEGNSDARVDRKPLILPGGSGLIELSSDEDVIVTPTTKRRKNSSFYIRLVVKEVATQTDDTKTADAGINTDNVTTGELGVNTDEPAKTIEIGVNTDVATNDNTGETTDNDMDVDEDNHEHTATTSSTRDNYYQCKVCSCYYQHFNLFQKHSQTQHNRAVSVNHKKVAYNSKCRFCSANYVFITYNKHIKNKHSEKFSTKGNNGKRGKDEPYTCTVCNAIFLSYNDGKRHRKVHSDVDQKFILRKLKTSEAPNTPGAKAEGKKTTPLHRAPIPKSMLFQCPKCQLNFFTYRRGLRHTIACKRGENMKGIAVNCSKCDNKFISGHIRNHNAQHEMTNEFKICPIEDGMENRILYRCMKCKICMEERSCNIHFQSGCHRSTGVPCTICHVKIDRDLMSKHKNAHGCMGMTKEQVILVDICDF